MARPVKGCTTPWSQIECTVPKSNLRVPQQEEQPNSIEGKVIVDYVSNIDYEGSEPENKTADQEEKEEDIDEEYAKIELPRDGTVEITLEDGTSQDDEGDPAGI